MMSPLGIMQGSPAASKAELDGMVLEALDDHSIALLDLKQVLDAELATRIRAEVERQRGRVR